MSENKGSEKQGEKLQLKYCMAMKWGFVDALISMWSRAVLTLIPVGVIILALYGFRMLIGGETPLMVRQRSDMIITAFGLWLIVFLVITIIWRDPFVEYWQQNVVGYNLWIWEDGKQIVSQICYRRHGQGGRGIPDDLNAPAMAILLPLGGWLHWPAFYGLEYGDFWTIKIIGLKDNNLMVELRDKAGCRLIVEAKQGFKLIEENYSVQCILDRLQQYAITFYQPDKYAIRHMQDQAKRFDAVVSAATQAIRDIMNTRRLGQSTDAAAIRCNLINELIKVLPADSRIDELQHMLKQGPAQRPPKGNRRKATAASAKHP